jgi:hypothetical protein
MQDEQHLRSHVVGHRFPELSEAVDDYLLVAYLS